jgi:putative oxidoreductase
MTPTEDLGKLILRFTLGGLLLTHGWSKMVYGINFIKRLVVNAGLPEALAYGVYVGEVAAPLLVLIGWYGRAAAGVIVINMAAAVYLVHMGDLLAFTEHGGWRLELQAFYLFTALTLMLIGPGRFSVNDG